MKIASVVETYDRIVREVKSDLVIVGAGEFVGGNKTPVVVKAIWDTGAYDIMLPNKLVIRGVEVSESDLKVCDALIGMDVISLGDMKVTNKPTTKFIFRIPAEGDTPLVAES